MSLSSRTCAREVMEAVLPAMWFIRRQMRQHRGELSLPQFRILVRIRREPEASLSALADHLGASLSTVSRAVTSLVEKGYLSRTDSPADRRQLSLTITPDGQQVLDSARQAAQSEMATLFEPLSPEQRRTLVQAMVQVRLLFTGEDEPADGLGYIEADEQETSNGSARQHDLPRHETAKSGEKPQRAAGIPLPPASVSAIK